MLSVRRAEKSDCAIIGGGPCERFLLATKLRRIGISVFFDFHDRKRNKMFKRASSENRWGPHGVYDIDNPDDRAWLERDDLAAAGV